MSGNRETAGVHGALEITGQGLRGLNLINPLTSAGTPVLYRRMDENRVWPLQAKPYIKAHL